MTLNGFDYLILVILLVFSYRGYNSGLISQITSLLGMICAIYFASEQYKIFAVVISDKFNLSSSISQLLSFSFLIIIVSLIINYMGYLLSEFLDLIFLSIIDDLSGAFFGLVKGGLIIYIVLLFITRVPIDSLQQKLNNSFLVSLLLDNLNPLFTKKIEQFIN